MPYQDNVKEGGGGEVLPELTVKTIFEELLRFKCSVTSGRNLSYRI